MWKSIIRVWRTIHKRFIVISNKPAILFVRDESGWIAMDVQEINANLSEVSEPFYFDGEPIFIKYNEITIKATVISSKRIWRKK